MVHICKICIEKAQISPKQSSNKLNKVWSIHKDICQLYKLIISVRVFYCDLRFLYIISPQAARHLWTWSSIFSCCLSIFNFWCLHWFTFSNSKRKYPPLSPFTSCFFLVCNLFLFYRVILLMMDIMNFNAILINISNRVVRRICVSSFF